MSLLLGLGRAMDLGDHRPQDPTYGFEECSRRIAPRSLPRADVDLDAIGSGDGSRAWMTVMARRSQLRAS
jgi:hypothetical protein